ncbi:MAG: HlyC/CorC family transporter [Halofilum sp. (in: g-proteobacteria)]|nr:HlyC/CorC family transporter [Halofilum sp. (in: g-proteobacteria)]
MNELPLYMQIGALAVLLVLSGCFSGSETALMTVNRYRLRHQAREGHRGARLALRLLERTDRLIGLILLGNNFVNVLASMLATIVAIRLWGEGEGVLGFTAIGLTVIVLIFGETAPKTFAALHPERVAIPAAFVYTPMLRLLYPIVWTVNLLANGVLWLLGMRRDNDNGDRLSAEELRTVVNETGHMIPRNHQDMLVNILDLAKVSVNDIMVPRSEIQGVDLDEDWDDVAEQMAHASNSRLPVYHESIDQVVGFIFLRDLIGRDLREMEVDDFRALLREPYFVPEGTALTRQLVNFQRHRRRIGLVVDEYGDILGLITLEDILEEIVGEFTTDRIPASRDIHPQADGSYICTGGTNLRDLGRLLGWRAPTDGPKTLNGLILEYMEMIPEPGTTFLVADHPVEIIQTRDNAVRSARIWPRIERSERLARGVAEIPMPLRATNADEDGDA